jgi:hypothetical protein
MASRQVAQFSTQAGALKEAYPGSSRVTKERLL